MESVSVIIPVYNCKEFLGNCVTSVTSVNDFCRTVFVREIILVDDGSTDGSSELCDDLSKTSGSGICRIRVIHQNNRGVSAARNAGLGAALGTYVLFVDSDDTVDSRKLADLMQKLEQDISTDMVVFGMSFDYYASNRIYRQERMLPPFMGTKTYDECEANLYNLFINNMLSSVCNKLIRRDVIERSRIRLQEDMILYEDLEFSLRVLAQCRLVHFCTEPIYYYRQVSDESNAGRRLKRIAHIPSVIAKIEDALIPFGDQTDVLLSVYLVLARGKNSCASRKEIDVVCNDFREWIDQRELKSKITNNKQAMILYNGNSNQILFRRKKAKIRHRLANWLKQNVGDFRKWRSQS